MTLNDFMNEAISPWVRTEGPDSDIVLSSRIRLARNFADVVFPTIAKDEELINIQTFLKETYAEQSLENYKKLELDRKSTRLNYSHVPISHAGICCETKNKTSR